MENLVNKQKTYFKTDVTKSYEFRLEQLNKLKQMIVNNQSKIEKALNSDLNKSSFEAYTTEVGFVILSLNEAIKKLSKWMKTKRARSGIIMMGSGSFIQPEPRGTILIIGPFNYPFQLVIEPLIGAIAAGNTAILKPSKYTPATSELLEKLIAETFDEEYIKVVQGQADITSELVKQKLDYIFFTGSTRVGQLIYEQAAKNLTPVTLELGGKSPTIVDETADLGLAARRIAFGKFSNAGQTCIAPDYIYVHESVKVPFIKELKNAIDSFYNDKATFGRIVNQLHFKRLEALIEKDKVVHGGKSVERELYIQPTILEGVEWKDKVMQEEIFGPILPILTYKNLDNVIAELREKDKPLALYIFTKSKENKDKVFKSLSFGGGAVNDTIMHVANSHLPFGGVGASGIGSYHGKTSFDTFSHFKSYVVKNTLFDLKLLYPPYSKKTEETLKKFIK
jgi:aldehyde dehydrogenase (NAD+)